MTQQEEYRNTQYLLEFYSTSTLYNYGTFITKKKGGKFHHALAAVPGGETPPGANTN